MGIIDYIPRVYLIDTENIGRKLLQELDKLRDIDKAIIFESDKSFRLSFKEILNIDNSKISVIETHNSAKNAMDFMIVSTLGHLVTVNKDKIYIIVSNDTGFDEVVNFWKFQGLYVRRHTDIGIDDISLETQMHRTKELQLKELTKIYDIKDNDKSNDNIELNVNILNRIIVLRSNESAIDIATIIYNHNDFTECKENIAKCIRYDKNNKLNIIYKHWGEFFHNN